MAGVAEVFRGVGRHSSVSAGVRRHDLRVVLKEERRARDYSLGERAYLPGRWEGHSRESPKKLSIALCY